jgi:hypothetical protein
MTRYLSATAICLLLSAPALAQNARSNANADASSSSRSSSIGVGNAFGNQTVSSTGGQGGSVSNVINTPTTPPTNTGRNAGATNSGNRTSTSTSTESETNNNSGNNITHTPQFAPSIFAPSVGPGAGCDSYISLGGSGPGAGGAFAFPWENQHCEDRSNAITLNQLGLKDAALQRMCFNDNNAEAMAAAGYHCRVGHVAEEQARVAAQHQPGAYAAIAPLATPAAYYEDNKGRRFVEVDCHQKHTTHSADGVCLNPQ